MDSKMQELQEKVDTECPTCDVRAECLAFKLEIIKHMQALNIAPPVVAAQLAALKSSIERILAPRPEVPPVYREAFLN